MNTIVQPGRSHKSNLEYINATFAGWKFSIKKKGFMDEKSRAERLSLLGRVFTPSAPITAIDFFVRRLQQVDKVVDTIGEAGQHAVLYGERGVGKTSLANFVEASFDKTLLTVKSTCNRSDSISNMWNKVFKKIAFKLKSRDEEGKEVYEAPAFLTEDDEFNPSDVLEEVEKLHQPILIILDEFDNISNPEIRVKFADIIKALSDDIPYVTILVVGIADSVNELIGDHPSLERCLRQIRLNRMSHQELKQIIENGIKQLEIKIDESVENDIIEFSQGFPHYVHLLTKYAAKTAIEEEIKIIGRQCFDVAIDEAIDNAQETIRKLYETAIITTRNQDGFKNVLWASALAVEDEHGTFRAVDIEAPLLKITGKQLRQQSYSYNLGKLCQEEKGAVLQKGESPPNRYRFKNPLLKAYIRLKLYQSGKI